jgi:ribonuclease HI
MKIIQFDGGAVPNPGTRGIGVILLEDNHVLKEISRKLDGIGTNNEAEYSALIEGLKQALALGWTDILVQGDSKLVVNQVAGSWKVNKDNLKPLNEEAKTLLSKFQSVKVEWIPREKNARADAAASRALGFDEALGVG